MKIKPMQIHAELGLPPTWTAGFLMLCYPAGNEIRGIVAKACVNEKVPDGAQVLTGANGIIQHATMDIPVTSDQAIKWINHASAAHRKERIVSPSEHGVWAAVCSYANAMDVKVIELSEVREVFKRNERYGRFSVNGVERWFKFRAKNRSQQVPALRNAWNFLYAMLVDVPLLVIEEIDPSGFGSFQLLLESFAFGTSKKIKTTKQIQTP